MRIAINGLGTMGRSLVRVLKENGLLFLLTPNRKFRLLPFQRPFNSDHYQEFTAKQFMKVLKNNFKNVEVKGTRAKDWIEEIERKRVQKSSIRAYKRHPFVRILKLILPSVQKTILGVLFVTACI